MTPTLQQHNACAAAIPGGVATAVPYFADGVQAPHCSETSYLLVEVWEDRASAAAVPPLRDNRVFCPVVSSKVCASVLRSNVAAFQRMEWAVAR